MYNYASEISSQLVDDLLTSNVVNSNIIQTDVLREYNNAFISLQADIFPDTANSYSIGSQSFPLNTVNSFELQSQYGNITSIKTDFLSSQSSSGNIIFSANLIPSIDDYYYVGVPTQRWKRVNIVDLNATGNVNFTSAQLSLVDESTIIKDDIDNNKQFRFEANILTPNVLRILTIPDATTTLVGNNNTQSLTNKTIIDPTNIVRATQLATTGADVQISSASPPSPGQVLMATTSTSAQWQNANSIASAIVIENNGTPIVGTPHSTLSFNSKQNIIISAANAGSMVANITVSLPTTSKGDLLVHDNTNNVRQPVGTNDYLLTANSLSSTGISWSPPTFKDTLFKIVDNTDNTKQITFDVNGNTNTKTTFVTSSTTNRTITFPNATTTVVGNNTTQSLTNKTIVDPSNTVRATQLATSTTDILLSGASAPVSGQVLTAINGTTAKWMTPNVTASTINIKNNGVNIAGTPHQSLNFLSSKGVTISGSNYTSGNIANVIVSLPTTTKGDLVIYDGVNNVREPVGSNDYLLTANSASSTGVTWTGPIFKDSLFKVVNASDSTKQIVFSEIGSTNTSTTILASQTTNRVVTLPDATTTLVGNNNTQTLTNKSLVDNSTKIVDATDNSKYVWFDAAGSTNTNTRLRSTQTSNVILSLPNSTDTIVANNFSATLTNKTITGATNYVGANELKTTGSPVVISSASPPITGQVLISTSATSAVWRSANLISGAITLQNNGSNVTGTPHSKLNFTSSQGITITATNSGLGVAAISVSVPTTTKGDLIVFNGTNNVRQAVGTNDYLLVGNSLSSTGVSWSPPVFKDSLFKIVNASDSTKQIIFSSTGTTGTSTTFIASQTANRTLTLPNATDTIVSNNFSATLTNKNITGTTNYVGANELKTTGSPVVISSASPPITGQVLISTSSTSAVWRSANLISGAITLQNNESNVTGTPHSKLNFTSSQGITITATNSGLGVAAISVSVPTTTKGDLIVYNGTNNVRQPVGTNDYLITANSLSSTGVSWLPPVFKDSLFKIVNASDSTKQIIFSSTGTTGTSTTFIASQTANRTLTLPNATDTIVSNNFSATLTNKNITGATNYVGANELKTTGSPVVISSASPPITGQVLISTSSTSAVWRSANLISGAITLQNNGSNVTGTPHNKLNFTSSQGITIAATNSGSGVAAISVSVPTTTKGDLIVYNGTNNVRQPVGTNDYLITANSLSSTGVSWSPPVFKDSLFKIVNVSDSTKQINFSSTGTTGTSTTFIASQTANRTLTLPNATDTIVSNNFSATLTNKNITGSTNYVGANELKTTGSPVVISSATPPITGQVLISTSSTSAVWRSANLISGAITLQNNGSNVTGTPHSKLNFTSSQGITIAATNSGSGVAAITVSVPTTTKGDLIVYNGTTNVRQAVGTNDYLLIGNSLSTTGVSWSPPVFKDSLFKIVNASDSTKQIIFSSTGTTGTSTTFIASQTANRTLTLPNATDTIVSNNFSATLTNKTITGATNYVGANELKTTGSPVVISSSSPPITGQVLISTSSTSAVWRSANLISGAITLQNNGSNVTGTPHSKLNFTSSQGITIAATNSGSGVAAITVSVPTTTKGDLIVYNGTNNVRQPVGTNDYLLVGNSLSSTGITWSPPVFKDSLFKIVNASDSTKQIIFSSTGTTGTSTTFIASQTANRTLTLPNATDTIVSNNFSATLTNKNITGSTNYVGANELKTTGSPVVISSAIPPITGQVLTATTATTAIWKDVTLPSGTVDTQQVSSTTTTSTTSLVYVDLDTITPFTITTNNTATIKYIVEFSAIFSQSSANRRATFIININGTDVAASEKGIDTQHSNTRTLTMTHCFSSIPNGQIIKVRYRTTGGTLSVFQRVLTIQGTYY